MSPTSWLRCCLVTSEEPPTVYNVTASTSQSEDQTPATNIMEWTTVAFVVEDQQHITHEHHICVVLQQKSRQQR